MQYLNGYHTTAQRLVNVNVFGIDIVAYAHHAGVSGHIVDAERPNVGVFVNDAGRQMLAGAVNYLSARLRQVLTDAGNLAILEQYIGILKNALLLVGPHGGIFDQQRFNCRQRSCAVGHKGIKYFAGFILFRCCVSLVRSFGCEVACAGSTPVDPGAIGQLAFAFEALVITPAGEPHAVRTVLLRLE